MNFGDFWHFEASTEKNNKKQLFVYIFLWRVQGFSKSLCSRAKKIEEWLDGTKYSRTSK